MKKFFIMIAFILVGWSAALAQSSQVKELTNKSCDSVKSDPEIYLYFMGIFAPIDEDYLWCPTDFGFCVVKNDMVMEDIQSAVWCRDGNIVGSEPTLVDQHFDFTSVVSVEIVDLYGNTYTDSKTIQIRPPAPPLEAWAELVQDTINGLEGYFVTLSWDNSQPRVYDALWLLRNGVSVGSVGYIEGFFMDPVPINPLEPPVYEVEVQDACNYPSFSQIFEVMYLSQHEDFVSDGYWLVLDVGLVNSKNDTRTIHILNENDEDLIQVPLVAAHDSIFVTSDWMSQFSSIRAGLSIESEDKDGTIVSYSNWVDSPSYDGLSENVSAVVVYPNPTTGIVNVQQVEGLENITVFDCLGRTVQTIPNFGDSASVQLNLLPFGKGVYYLRIQTAAAVEVRKIVVR